MDYLKLKGDFMKILLLGQITCGKGTLSENLAEKYGYQTKYFKKGFGRKVWCSKDIAEQRAQQNAKRRNSRL